MPHSHGVQQGEAPRARGLVALRVALLVTSLGAIAYGVAQGEALSVLAKGVMVCLECIGIA